VIIGIDMLGIQSPESRKRGIGRYCLHLLSTLFERHPEHEYVLYRHEGLPSDGLPEPSRGHWRDLPGELPTRRDAPEAVDMDHLTWVNPDGLDVMLTLSPFEWQKRYIPPAHGRNLLKTAAIVYDLIPLQFQDRYLTDPTMRNWYTRWTKLLTSHDLLLTISDSTRNDVLEVLGMDPRRVLTIGTASDPSYFTPDPAGRGSREAVNALRELGIHRPFLFNVSGDDDRKNALGLVEAFARLPRSLQDSYQLVISCKLSPARVATIHELARERGVLDQVVVTGPVCEETLRRLYQQCELFVFPSLYEGFGLPILEAMHCGAPVIAGRNSSQIEIVEGAGVLVNATDPTQVADKIAHVLMTHGLADQLREQSKARAAEYDWAHVVDRLDSAFERMVASGTSLRRRRPTEQPRIAIVAPAEIRCPDQARSVERLVNGLLDTYAIDLYHDSPLSTPTGLRSDQVGCFHHTTFDRNATYKQYRAVLCHLGNAPEYRFCLDILEKHRAIAVLQDLGLARVQLARAADHGGTAAFHEVLRSCYGARAESLFPLFDRLPAERDLLLPALDTLGVMLHRRVFETSDAVVVGSASLLQRSLELTPALIKKARVIPSGLDSIDVEPDRREALRHGLGLARETPVIGVFGPLPAGRRADVLLEAFRAFRGYQPDAHLLFVSTEASSPALAAQIEQRGGDQVRVRAWRSMEERNELMATVNVAVLSQSPGPLGEPPTLLSTLLATGVPTIVDQTVALDSEWQPLVFHGDLTAESHTGLLAPLTAIAQSPSEALARARSARELVLQRQTWDRVIASYRELIEQVRTARPRSIQPPSLQSRSVRSPVLAN